jgi:dienelactone hydrolase
MTRTRFIAALAACALGTSAAAEVQTKEIEYREGDTTLQGFLAWDDAAKGKRPGVLVVHEWWGHNAHARKQARRLAEADFVGLAVDMFGKGKVTTHPEDAKGFMAEATKNAGTLAARFDAGLALLKQQPQVNPKKIGAAGYCFGGTVALEMARAGKPLDAIATFHAGLAPRGEPARKGKVKAPVLAQTGGQDPMIPPEQVSAFEEEMKQAGVKAKVIVYPGARHAFTNPDADKAGMDALAYDAEADRKSWEEAARFFRETLGK